MFRRDRRVVLERVDVSSGAAGRARHQAAAFTMRLSTSCREIFLDRRYTSRELGEGPAAEAAEVVDAGHPQVAHRFGLGLGVLAAIALDLEDQVERLVAGRRRAGR